MSKTDLYDADIVAWADAVVDAAGETGLSAFPEDCPWRLTDVLEVDWLPE